MKKKVALHFLKTVSFKSDGRVLKWVDSLSASNILSIASVIEDRNEIKSEIIHGTKVNYHSFYFRRFFKKKKGYLFKVIEYLWKSNKEIIKFSKDIDIVVFHDVQQYLNLFWLLFFKKNSNKTVIWDLHELPHSGLATFKPANLFICYILNNVDVIVYTNQERRDYILKKYRIDDRERNFVLNNYPSDSYNYAPITKLPENVIIWLNNERYILWLGAANKERNFEAFFEVYSKYKFRFKLIIIGKIDIVFKERLANLIKEGYVYNDFVSQDEIIKYVDNAFFSVVLYNDVSPNNLLCEPNRLFQLINRNIPCIVGHNPTLKNVIIESGGGVVLNDAGISEDEMLNAFELMIEKRDIFKTNIIQSKIKEKFNWDNQFSHLSDKFL